MYYHLLFDLLQLFIKETIINEVLKYKEELEMSQFVTECNGEDAPTKKTNIICRNSSRSTSYPDNQILNAFGQDYPRRLPPTVPDDIAHEPFTAVRYVTSVYHNAIFSPHQLSLLTIFA